MVCALKSWGINCSPALATEALADTDATTSLDVSQSEERILARLNFKDVTSLKPKTFSLCRVLQILQKTDFPQRIHNDPSHRGNPPNLLPVQTQTMETSQWCNDAPSWNNAFLECWKDLGSQLQKLLWTVGKSRHKQAAEALPSLHNDVHLHRRHESWPSSTLETAVTNAEIPTPGSIMRSLIILTLISLLCPPSWAIWTTVAL